MAFCSRPETASDVVWPIVRDTPVKFRDPRLNHSREIRPKAVGGGIFNRFLNVDNFQPEEVSDIISGVVVELRGMDIQVKLLDSRSNRSRDI